MGFFAIMNPIANTPIFLGLIEGKTPQQARRIARTATGMAFCIVFVFVLLGQSIFTLFGMSIPAFKITGGILIFYVGFEMLMSKKSKVHGALEDKEENIAVCPLAIPILAGPGTLVTAMNYAMHSSAIELGIILGVFAVMCGFTYLAFFFSQHIMDKVGANLIAVIGKIMGLILAVIGMGMISSGIKMTFQL